ncbi:MAG: hypothetical protein NT091_02660 [Candidatus Falkowbacteria bacterium]|nr:hypothetical protein [Candidatus Falkowbacteria bacterium]
MKIDYALGLKLIVVFFLSYFPSKVLADACSVACTPTGALYQNDGDYGWYAYAGHLDKTKLTVKARGTDVFMSFDDDEAGYCESFAQVVTMSGQNKYWSDRVHRGSNYKTPISSMAYDAKNEPFGSVAVPADSLFNPYEWGKMWVRNSRDSSGNVSVSAGTPYSFNNDNYLKYYRFSNRDNRLCIPITGTNQNPTYNQNTFYAACALPLDLKNLNTDKAAGIKDIKRLFAQSYGEWTLVNGKYQEDKVSKDISVNACNGGVMAGQLCDISQNDCPGGECKIVDIYVNIGVCSNNTNTTCCPDASKLSIIDIDSCAVYNTADTTFACDTIDHICKSPSTASASGRTTPGTCSIVKTPMCDGKKVAIASCVNGSCVKSAGMVSTMACVGGAKDTQETIGNPSHINHTTSCTMQFCIDGTCDNTKYVQHIDGAASTWGPPTTTCLSESRPSYVTNSDADYCAIVPIIKNIKVNGLGLEDVMPIIQDTQSITLTFNTEVDSQQLPLVMVSIGWGDGENISLTGADMRSRIADNSPHSFTHLYSYWDLRAKYNDGKNDFGIKCPTNSSSCTVAPKIKVRDNWGWCNGGTSINDCTHFVLGPKITVTEK